MTLSKLNPREQLLSALVIIVLVLGSYILLRFLPENKSIVSLQKQAAKTERKLLSARVPDEPDEGVETLLKKLDDEEQSLALINEMENDVAQRLAPFDSQQIIILISQLAGQSNVLVKTSEAFKLTTASSRKNKKTKTKKKKNTNKVIDPNDVIFPASRSWIDRLSAHTMFHRPMHRLVLEGDYESLRKFIHGLDDLAWQVTVVRFNIEKMPTAPIRGYAQKLKSELVLAL